MEMRKLKGKLLEHKKTYKNCAYILKCSVTTVNNKMQGKIPFDCWEAERISEWLGFSDSEKIDIFLIKILHNMQENMLNNKGRRRRVWKEKKKSHVRAWLSKIITIQ